MITLGLAGGIGSGKSAAARILDQQPGVRVVYADRVAKRLMNEAPAVRQQLTDRFGPEVYHPDDHAEAGRLNRSALAARVFENDDERKALNAIVHPAVREAMLAEIERARTDGLRGLVYEAALLFETGAEEVLDAVIVVDAPVETRIQRVMARDGVSREQVTARMAAQMDPAETRRRADAVLVNDGSLADLRERTLAVLNRLTRDGTSSENEAA